MKTPAKNDHTTNIELNEQNTEQEPTLSTFSLKWYQIIKETNSYSEFLHSCFNRVLPAAGIRDSLQTVISVHLIARADVQADRDTIYPEIRDALNNASINTPAPLQARQMIAPKVLAAIHAELSAPKPCVYSKAPRSRLSAPNIQHRKMMAI